MEYLNDAELRSLLEVTYAQDRLMHMMVLTTLCHALRSTELLSLRPEDIDGAYINVNALKNGNSRLEPLHSSSDPLLDERVLAVHAHGIRAAGGAKLFTMSRATADRQIKHYCALAGIPSAKAHWHSLRHSNAMIVFHKTCSLGAVKQSLRHCSWSSALIYLNESDSQKAFAALREGLTELASKPA